MNFSDPCDIMKRTIPLYDVHTIQFNPRDPNLVLISSSGSEFQIIEFDIRSKKITWAYNPWVNGFMTTKHGLNMAAKGKDYPKAPQDKKRVIVGFETAKGLIENAEIKIPDNESWLMVVDFDKLPENDSHHGTQKWQRGLDINYAGYNKWGNILATTFGTGQAGVIDKQTFEMTFIVEGMVKPHALIPFKEGYILTDSGRGLVFMLDKNGKIIKEFDFTNLPLLEDDDDDSEWMNNTYPLTEDLLVSVDFRRQNVYVWNPLTLEFSIYPNDPKVVLQAVVPVSRNIPKELPTSVLKAS